KELEKYAVNYKNYKEGYDTYDSKLYEIWTGISEGGIGRGLVMQKKYEEAIPYLKHNIEKSEQHRLFGDLAKAQNLLAEVYEQQNSLDSAVLMRKKAYSNASKAPRLRELIVATRGIENLYIQQQRYDSAYFYSKKLHAFESQSNQ